MKLTCEKNKLTEAVSKVQIATSSSSLPALEGIFFECKDGYLTLTGYNLEMGITTAIDAKTEQNGLVIMSARYFSEIVRKIPGNIISIETDEKYICTIKSGETKFSIIGMPPEEYPDLPTVNAGEGFEIEGNLLCSMIRQTRVAVSKKEDKPIYNGICFYLKEGVITLAALDGYRLAIRKEKTDFEGQLKFVVPEKTLTEITKIIGEGEDKVKISVEKKHIIFEIGGVVVVSRLLEGEFMDWETAVPQKITSTVMADTHMLRSCIDRVSLVVNDRDRVFVRCFFEQSEFKAMCDSTVGNAVDKVPVNLEGDRVEIGFNSRYLIDALRAVEDDVIKIELNGPFSPIKIVPKEGDSFMFIVLPVRITKA